MIAAGAWDPGEEIEWRAYFMGLQAEAKEAGLDARALEEAEEARRKLAQKVTSGAKGGGSKDEAYSQEQLDLARKHPSVFSDSLPAKPQARGPMAQSTPVCGCSLEWSRAAESSIASRTRCGHSCRRRSRS